jgi:hypothetical protein
MLLLFASDTVFLCWTGIQIQSSLRHYLDALKNLKVTRFSITSNLAVDAWSIKYKLKNN